MAVKGSFCSTLGSEYSELCKRTQDVEDMPKGSRLPFDKAGCIEGQFNTIDRRCCELRPDPDSSDDKGDNVPSCFRNTYVSDSRGERCVLCVDMGAHVSCMAMRYPLGPVQLACAPLRM
eukprot:UN1395